MAKVALKFLLMSAGIVASALIVMIPLSTVDAAEECLTAPKNETPQGKHWYYRFERGTKRTCWYLREEGETSSQTAASKPARRVAPDVATKREAKPARSADDARAEISPTTPASSVDPRGVEPKLSNNTSSETVQSPVTSRWPEPTSVFSSATERPISPSFVVTSAAPDTKLYASADADLAREVAPVAPVKVEPFAMEAPVSLQGLLLGTFGVIAVLSFTENAIYLIALVGMRRRSQRHTSSNPPKWPREGSTNRTGIPRWLEPMAGNSTRRLDPGRDAAAPSLERQRSGLGDDAREIEQLLARFANEARA